MKRNVVFEAINRERDYQDSMTPDRSVCKTTLSQMDRIGLMEVCLNRAKEAWYSEPGKALETVSEQFRKVAALCVQDGEQNGMPYRQE